MKKLIILIYKLVSWIFFPFTFLISKIGKPEPLCDYEDKEAIKSKMIPGDILICRENRRLSNWFIPGYYGHGAQVQYNYRVIESIPAGVRVQHIDQFVLSKDAICLLRPKYKIRFRTMERFYITRKYDFWFWFSKLTRTAKLYCMELVYLYQEDICEGEMPYRPKKMFWFIEYLYPDDLIVAFKDHYEIIYEARHR